VTILGVAWSLVPRPAGVLPTCWKGNTFNGAVYTWLVTAATCRFEIGFLIDRLSATMMVVVTFVSLMVHVYTIGYMPTIRATSASSPTSRCSPSRC
jgi:NADH-quinone oxidoreductase subunit L